MTVSTKTCNCNKYEHNNQQQQKKTTNKQTDKPLAPCVTWRPVPSELYCAPPHGQRPINESKYQIKTIKISFRMMATKNEVTGRQKQNNTTEETKTKLYKKTIQNKKRKKREKE